MKSDKLLLITENLPEQRILEAIFAARIKEDQLEVRSYLLTSAAISVAVSSLLGHPERPIALVLNTDTEDPIAIEELRGTVGRMLGHIATQGWHLALAVPRLNSWAKADPRIRKALESAEAVSNPDQAVRIRDLVRSQPFNVQALRKKNAEFRGLDDFITRIVDESSATRRPDRPRTAR